jgi:hypothetical protein
MVVVSESNRKMLFCLQKHIHPKFKPGDYFSQLYIYIFVFTLRDKRKNLKNKVELDFHCTGYSVHPFIWPQIWKKDKM